MNYKNIYNEMNLPNVLSEEEFKKYYYQFKNGSEEARNILIEHNLRLIVKIISLNFKETPYNSDELFSVGSIGLIKAVDTYDLNKDRKFSTYASRCIKNEILMLLRKNKNKPVIESLEATIPNEKVEQFKLKDVIADTSLNQEENIINNQSRIITNNIAYQVLDSLNDREKDIIMMYFGFKDGKRYLKKEIAEKHNLSQSHITRLINKTLTYLKKELLKSIAESQNSKITYNEFLNTQRIDIKQKIKKP